MAIYKQDEVIPLGTREGLLFCCKCNDGSDEGDRPIINEVCEKDQLIVYRDDPKCHRPRIN